MDILFDPNVLGVLFFATLALTFPLIVVVILVGAGYDRFRARPRYRGRHKEKR